MRGAREWLRGICCLVDQQPWDHIKKYAEYAHTGNRLTASQNVTSAPPTVGFNSGSETFPSCLLEYNTQHF
jgi:hypothetical protein